MTDSCYVMTLFQLQRLRSAEMTANAEQEISCNEAALASLDYHGHSEQRQDRLQSG
jgi:hypothetical protein